ncbi:MAG: YjbQ family protein [Endomicrobiales bacterium]|nr:YjbQ family protein [Endomicrobiales bacterium]
MDKSVNIAEFFVRTTKRTDFIEITRKVQEAVTKSKIKNGICHIFIPHTTAGIIINEHADPDVIADISETLEKIVPWKNNYSHMEGNSAAHIKSSIAGTSKSVFIENGNLMLGTWQGIFFAEFDGPRSRKVWIKIV